MAISPKVKVSRIPTWLPVVKGTLAPAVASSNFVEMGWEPIPLALCNVQLTHGCESLDLTVLPGLTRGFAGFSLVRTDDR